MLSHLVSKRGLSTLITT
jgi:lipoate-protein ligase A